jgi:hypothetical protein
LSDPASVLDRCRSCVVKMVYTTSMTDESLPDGLTTGAVLTGDVVHKPTAPWTSTVHALLRHLEDVGFDDAPRRGDGGIGAGVATLLPWSAEHVVRGSRPRLAGESPDVGDVPASGSGFAAVQSMTALAPTRSTSTARGCDHLGLPLRLWGDVGPDVVVCGDANGCAGRPIGTVNRRLVPRAALRLATGGRG